MVTPITENIETNFVNSNIFRGLKDTLYTATFRYNWKFNEVNPEPYFIDFFNSPVVRKHFENVTRSLG